MKKTVFLLAFLAAFFLAPQGFGQVYFHEDFQNAKLDNHASAYVDTVWTLYNDDNKVISDLSFFDTAWKIYADADNGRFAASPSYFKGSGKADRWLVSPAITLTDAQNPVLVFRVKSLDAKNRDNLEVKISTTDSAKASFSKTLQTVSRAQVEWTYHTLDLSEYKGQTIFLAFVQNSNNCYMIGLDDVSVYEKNDNQMFICGVSAPMAVLTQSFPYTLSVKATLYNAGDKRVSSCTLAYNLDGGEQKNITVSTGIEPGAAHEVSFDIPVNEKGYRTVNLSMENAPASQVLSFVALHTALPRQCLLWESFSSGMCSNCAPWNKMLHHIYVNLKTNVPDNSGNFVMAKYQVDIPAAGDPMVTNETNYLSGGRGKYYNIEYAPAFFMNGKKYQFQSYATDSEEVLRDFCQKELQDSLTAFRTRSSNLKLDGRLTRDNNAFYVETCISTCYPEPDDYELMVVLLEDSIHFNQPQHNGEKDFFSIVRKVLTPTSGLVVTPANVGDSVKKSFSFVFDEKNPRIFNGLDGVNAVIYLQNTRTRQIRQALYLKAGYPTTNDSTAIALGGTTVSNCTPKAAAARFDLYPNPAGERVNLRLESEKNQSLDVRVFNLAGTQVYASKWNVTSGMNHTEINTSAWQAGTYLVGIYSQEGVIVKKLILR